jgi:peroxiredoxin
MTTLKEGDQAPDFSAETAKGREMNLSALRGKNVVLYFYPKDDTPGCTIEAKEFTEMADKFANANTVVLGVSYDDSDCHQAFIDKYGLKVELVCDTKGEIAKAYGSWGEKYPARDTFLIGTDGRIKKIYRGVKPQGHAADVLTHLK